jgi:hypothetical protein
VRNHIFRLGLGHPHSRIGDVGTVAFDRAPLSKALAAWRKCQTIFPTRWFDDLRWPYRVTSWTAASPYDASADSAIRGKHPSTKAAVTVQNARIVRRVV